MSMPNLDGSVLANIVQHLNPAVKILAMSGLSSGGGESKMQRFMGAFLFKPFKVEALLQAVNKLLHPELVTEVA
jgi:DNA-binding NtrC family response regulator